MHKTIVVFTIQDISKSEIFFPNVLDLIPVWLESIAINSFDDFKRYVSKKHRELQESIILEYGNTKGVISYEEMLMRCTKAIKTLDSDLSRLKDIIDLDYGCVEIYDMFSRYGDEELEKLTKI